MSLSLPFVLVQEFTGPCSETAPGISDPKGLLDPVHLARWTFLTLCPLAINVWLNCHEHYGRPVHCTSAVVCGETMQPVALKLTKKSFSLFLFNFGEKARERHHFWWIKPVRQLTLSKSRTEHAQYWGGWAVLEETSREVAAGVSRGEGSAGLCSQMWPGKVLGRRGTELVTATEFTYWQHLTSNEPLTPIVLAKEGTSSWGCYHPWDLCSGGRWAPLKLRTVGEPCKPPHSVAAIGPLSFMDGLC